MTKHTPGPWEVVREDEHEWSIWYKYYVDGEKRPRSSWLADSINSEADARLIAAAPDLIEALKSIEEYWNQDQNETAMADACWHAINTARAAIARATGEQP